MSEAFTETLRHLRQQAGLSLKEAAARLGVHFTTISAWERGRSEPSLAGLQDLARLYGTDVDSLIHGGAGGADEEAFRPISPRAGEELIRRLEELRLGICLGEAIRTPEGAARLSAACGIPTGRLTEIAGGRAVMRPGETASLIRELGAPGTSDLFGGDASTVEGALPAAAAASAAALLEHVYRYLGGRPPRQ